ncbi:PA0069 family radical SAM protein [Penaeicola halotolerans]|uniref:PA0069 family radical SAM protein n=1 Tax=Penaeicola halotolerans TaxID=2793196 RepID=UPI001CF81BEA|nr:PA0069 family radical SAM protein [Penaeicola halotolerans]
MENDLLKGRGAQINPHNPYHSQRLVQDHVEGIDEEILLDKPSTSYFLETPKTVLSKNTSPDLALTYSVNPYQGCEHGCTYCYARNSHQYWGFDAGLDFETKIMVKPKVAQQLSMTFSQKAYKPMPIMLSGNTDCYQPAERKFRLTREILQVMLDFRHPVSVITKNSLIARDQDILEALAKENLVHVYFSINSMNEELRRNMEPRTASALKKIQLIREFTAAGIPVGIMIAPLIPSLNSHEIPSIMKEAAAAGAQEAGYTVVRLNGTIAEVFENWLREKYPARADKVLNQIKELHDGQLNDSEWGRRMKGKGAIATEINSLFHLMKHKFMAGRSMPAYDMSKFRRGGNYQLF